ncbi:L-threonine transporter, anaerobically inducible [Klebsiella pneumoniae]|uniref:L-threonine transporter, anaerobically inducible n=1 Tax=Klebsiella pneumoniae TaxID=573 RepID=A0A2X3FEM6_KLEPN|nr:L-threonine transporter, anaerobically inducible [Klebsiella pneumoniae]
MITFLYFFAICPLLWIYGVTITNTFMTFWENQLQMPALNRGVVALAPAAADGVCHLVW